MSWNKINDYSTDKLLGRWHKAELASNSSNVINVLPVSKHAYISVSKMFSMYSK